jgi:putative transposase
MEVIQSVKFRYEPNERVRKLLEDYKDMVNFAIQQAVENRVSSLSKLHQLVYRKLKEKYDYSTQYFVTAYRVALGIVRSWKRKGKKEIPTVQHPIVRLSKQLVKLNSDGTLRLSIRPRDFVTLKLIVGDYQKKFLEKGYEIGEILLNQECVIIPFKTEVSPVEPKGLMALDLNEENITGVSTNPHIIRVDTKELRTIHSTYFAIRRRIQKLSKEKPRTAKRLMAKYSNRERRRTQDLCHKVSRQIVDFAKQNGFGIMMENLRGIRQRIKYNKKLNRRLHSWNFYRLQFYIDYKTRLEGLPVVYVNPRGTSSTCPICGGKLTPNGYRGVRCSKCGYENDRDITACLNLLRMRGVPLPLKATYDFGGGTGSCPTTGKANF